MEVCISWLPNQAVYLLDTVLLTIHYTYCTSKERTCEGLPLVVVQQPSEGFGDNPAGGRQASGSHVGGLQQHGSNEVHALQQLQVDVHVEGHLPPPLQLLLLRRLVLVSATRHHKMSEICHKLVTDWSAALDIPLCMASHMSQ